MLVLLLHFFRLISLACNNNDMILAFFICNFNVGVLKYMMSQSYGKTRN